MDSAVCTEKQLLSPEFQAWARLFKRPTLLNRKIWEWSFTAQALKEYGMLQPGKWGLGFAVGTEPVPAALASFGVSIIATDLNFEEADKKGWVKTSQHCSNKSQLNVRGICPAPTFDKLVNFEFCDMNNIPSIYYGKFDFVWSSCALEHLGSMQKGIDFINNSLKCLKDGGIAVHTTEFNVSSNRLTVSRDDLYVYRKCDIEAIIADCHRQGYDITINWDCGTSFADYHVDLPPYNSHPHLKLKIENHTVTSIGLIITKPIVDIVVTNHAGSITLKTPIAPMTAGARTMVAVEVVNRSEQVWKGDAFYPVNLSYHWEKDSGEVVINDGLRTPLPAGGLGPGRSLAIEMQVEAPQEPGKYTLVLTLVQELINWFEMKSFKPARVAVDVLPVTLKSTNLFSGKTRGKI